MNNGEFYSSNEYNSTSEYRHFPAEMYIKPKEENKLGNEQADLGKEISTLQPKKKTQKSSDNKNSIIDKIFNSIKGVATTAAVAVSAVAVTTTLITGAPQVELKSLDCGDTYIEYVMEISELREDQSYSIVVSTSNEEDREIEVEGNGIYENTVVGLKPSWEYTLSLVCHDTSLGDVTHFEVKFQTVKHIEQQPNPPPSTYEGSYSLGDVVSNWQSNELTVPLKFEYLGEQYYYILKQYDGSGNLLSSHKGDRDKDIVLSMSDSSIYSLVLEIYGVGSDGEVKIKEQELAKLDYTPPSVNISDAIIVGMNEIQINFVADYIDDNCQIAFNITYGDLTEDNIILSSEDILNGYVIINMDSSNTLSIKPTASISYEESDSVRKIEYPLYERTFEETFKVEALVDTFNGRVTFYPKGIANGAEYAYIIESTSPDSPYTEYYFQDPFMIYYTGQGEITYTMYLTNENGDMLSSEATITIDTSVEVTKPEFNMIYQNPREVTITYNDDGTINMYIITNFEATNQELYYQVRLGSKRYASRDKVLVVENLPDTTYSIDYNVCMDINGMSYSVYSISPSGVTNEFELSNGYSAIYTDSTTLSLQLYAYYMYTDLNTVRLVSSSGEEIALSESNFTYNEESYSYDVEITFTKELEYVTVYIDANGFYEALDELEDYKGSPTKSYEITVYA